MSLAFPVHAGTLNVWQVVANLKKLALEPRRPAASQRAEETADGSNWSGFVSIPYAVVAKQSAHEKPSKATNIPLLLLHARGFRSGGQFRGLRFGPKTRKCASSPSNLIDWKPADDCCFIVVFLFWLCYMLYAIGEAPLKIDTGVIVYVRVCVFFCMFRSLLYSRPTTALSHMYELTPSSSSSSA